MELPTNPRTILWDTSPFFPRPKLVGFFSVDRNGKCTKDFSQLRYLNQLLSGDVHFNLNYNVIKELVEELNKDVKNNADIIKNISKDIDNYADIGKDNNKDVEKLFSEIGNFFQDVVSDANVSLDINKVANISKDVENNAEINTLWMLGKQNKEKLLYFLTHLKDHRETFDLFDKSEIDLEDVPFLCYRGFLSNASALPYKHLDSFRFSACLFHGVLYLYELQTPEERTQSENISLKDALMTLWGLKFEQFMTSENPQSKPAPNAPLFELHQFSCTYKGRLNGHRLIYGAEMDGVLAEKSSLTEKFQLDTYPPEYILEEFGKCQFVELKISRRIKEKKHEITFQRHKTRAWWLQCFYAGIDTLVCGFRDDRGVVRDVKNYKVSDLIEMNNGYWSPNICMNFCDNLLKYIKDCIAREIRKVVPAEGITNVRNLPMILLVFERLPGSNIRLSTRLPDENIAILSDWFINLFPKDS